MRVNGFVLHGAASLAVLASGVGAAIAGAGGGGVTLAGPQVLRLIQGSPAALSAYPAVKMAMTMSFDSSGRHVSVNEQGVVATDGKSAQFGLQLPNGLGPLSFIAAGNSLYAKASQHAAAMNGKRWVGLKVTPGAAPSQTPTGSDAMGYLRLMPGATGEVKVLGRQSIDHVRTTHYRVTIDLRKAAQSMPPQLQQASPEQLQQAGITTLPMDVWLDAQHAARQVELSMAMQGTRIQMRIRVSGTSTPVAVVAPPASDVFFVSSAAELFEDAINR